METYTFLRAFADSWVLLAMFTFFLGVAIWAFLPSQRAARDDAANIPFRDSTPDCDQACANCACKDDLLKGQTHG